MGEEETDVVTVCMPVELSTNDVGVTVCESVEPHRPLIESIMRRDMPDYIHELPYFL
jgi:hypothetical protein